MALKVIEGSWDEIMQHAQELQGRRLRVIVLPEPAPKRTGADLLQTLTEIGFIGQWADRTDLPDSPDYVRQMRQQIESRLEDATAGHGCDG